MHSLRPSRAGNHADAGIRRPSSRLAAVQELRQAAPCRRAWSAERGAAAGVASSWSQGASTVGHACKAAGCLGWLACIAQLREAAWPLTARAACTLWNSQA